MWFNPLSIASSIQRNHDQTVTLVAGEQFQSAINRVFNSKRVLCVLAMILLLPFQSAIHRVFNSKSKFPHCYTNRLTVSIRYPSRLQFKRIISDALNHAIFMFQSAITRVFDSHADARRTSPVVAICFNPLSLASSIQG